MLSNWLRCIITLRHMFVSFFALDISIRFEYCVCRFLLDVRVSLIESSLDSRFIKLCVYGRTALTGGWKNLDIFLLAFPATTRLPLERR